MAVEAFGGLATFEEWMEQTMLDGFVECPMCRSEQAWEEAFLGPMGTKVWFRCRCCGDQWTMDIDEDVTV